MNRLVLLWPLALLGLASTLGCSSSRSAGDLEPTRADELNQVAGMLRDFVSAHNRGPASANELARYQSEYRFGYQQVKSGDIVIFWGAKMAGEGGEGGTDAVVAYEKKVPAEGGLVLLHNGKVVTMSPTEFQSARKAGK